MATSRCPVQKSVDVLRASRLWLAEGRSQGHGATTRNWRELALKRFVWWLENEAKLPTTLDSIDRLTIREFQGYLQEPQARPRWGGTARGGRKPEEMRPSTVETYYRCLRSFTAFCLEEGLLEQNPFQNVRPPKIPRDQVQPLSLDQVERMIRAASDLCEPERDRAILWVLVDTGLRVSELISMDVSEWRHEAGCLICGKGNKIRSVYMQTAARRALWRYMERRLPMTRDTSLPGDAPLFVALRGRYEGNRLGRSAVHLIVQRAGRAAKLEGVRCSPHTLRHTFAVEFLRGGGNVFELMRLMGHEDVKTLERYVQLAQVDLEEAHRKASPGNRVKPR